MKAFEKSTITKSTIVKEQETEKDADTSKYRGMAIAGFSPRGPSYLMLARDGHDLAKDILQKKWPEKVEGLQDQKEGINIKNIQVMVLTSPTKLMIVPAGAIIDPKKARYSHG